MLMFAAKVVIYTMLINVCGSSNDFFIPRDFVSKPKSVGFVFRFGHAQCDFLVVGVWNLNLFVPSTGSGGQILIVPYWN